MSALVDARSPPSTSGEAWLIDAVITPVAVSVLPWTAAMPKSIVDPVNVIRYISDSPVGAMNV